MNRSPDPAPSSDASLNHVDRLLGAVLLVSLALVVAFGLLWFIPLETPAAAHPLHPSLRIRPESPDATLGFWALGLAISVLTVVLLALLGLVGVRRHGGFGVPALWVGGLFAVYGGVLIALMAVYLRTPRPSLDAFLLGMPVPSLILLVGVWHFPLVIVGMLVWRYHDWTLTPADLERFRALVASDVERESP